MRSRHLSSVILQSAHRSIDEVPMPDPDARDMPLESPAAENAIVPRAQPWPVEIGGRDGLEPTRYGDWEKNGRCIDF
jgi:hypothetical protein